MTRPYYTPFIIAALTYLILSALPARAYYPPLITTATSTSNSVTRQVYDPKLQKDVVHRSYYVFGDQEVISLQQHNGVVAWLRRFDSVYYVTICTYDPSLANPNPGIYTPFQEDTQGPFIWVKKLQVVDGMVAYMACTPPSAEEPDGRQECRWAIYVPDKKGWLKAVKSLYPDYNVFDLINKNGVVSTAFVKKFEESYYYSFYLYDHNIGYWSDSNITYGSNRPYIITIANATVYVDKDIFGADILGYDNSYGGSWQLNKTTVPTAWFTARPTSGFAPLWVWFTDMSIASGTFAWNFGDGQTSTSRSPYHTYSAPGIYQASQTVNGGPSNLTQPIKVGKAVISPLLLLLLQ